MKYATPQDIRDFGFIPEFMGRFPIITNVNKLSEEDLVRILTEPKNSLVKQYTEMLKSDNTELTFTDDALIEIAKVSNELETGARGLRSIMETILTDIMYEAPNFRNNIKVNKVNITSDFVRNIINQKYPTKNVA